MKIYLVCEEIDLGYHVHEAYVDRERANAVCELKNRRRRESNVNSLIEDGYTREEAEACFKLYYFSVEECELISD